MSSVSDTFELHTDASNHGVGSDLSVVQCEERMFYLWHYGAGSCVEWNDITLQLS